MYMGQKVTVYDNETLTQDARDRLWDWFWDETYEGSGCIFVCLRGDDVMGFRKFPEMNPHYEAWVARMMLDE